MFPRVRDAESLFWNYRSIAGKRPEGAYKGIFHMLTIEQLEKHYVNISAIVGDLLTAVEMLEENHRALIQDQLPAALCKIHTKFNAMASAADDVADAVEILNSKTIPSLERSTQQRITGLQHRMDDLQ